MATEPNIYSGIHMSKVQLEASTDIRATFIFTNIKTWSQFRLDTHKKTYLANQRYFID